MLYGLMLRKEEVVQELVHLHETLPAEPELPGFIVKEPAGAQPLQRLRKLAVHIDSEFLLEILPPHPSEFHLQDELPHHAFFGRRRKGAVKRKLALPDASHV